MTLRPRLRKNPSPLPFSPKRREGNENQAGGGLVTVPRPGGGGGGGAGTAVPVGPPPAFFELWYICVNKSSAMCPVSIDTLTMRLRKKALKKIEGTAIAIPRNVIERAAA